MKMMNYTEFLKDPSIFYVALGAFVVATLIDLYIRTRKVKHEDSSPMSHRMEIALGHFKEQKSRKSITNDTYQKLTGVSHATATRDLEKFIEFGYLEKLGKTSSTTYHLVNSRKDESTMS